MKNSYKYNLVLTLGVIFTFFGCCNVPYREVSSGIGYKDIKIENKTYNIYGIAFTGPECAEKEKVEFFNLFRCAEFAIDNGFNYFVVVKRISSEGERQEIPDGVFSPAFGGFSYKFSKVYTRKAFSAMLIALFTDKSMIPLNARLSIVNSKQFIDEFKGILKKGEYINVTSYLKQLRKTYELENGKSENKDYVPEALGSVEEALRKGDYDRAISDLNKVLEINPQDAEAYDKRSLAWYKKGDYVRAISDLKKAIELNPGFAGAYDKGSEHLMFAANIGQTKTVIDLLARGADVNAKDSNSWTALMIAAEKDHVETVKVLLAGGADVNAKNINGWTALMIAAEKDRVETVKVLLAGGADVNAKNINGWTALMIAAEKGNEETVKLLK